MTPSVSAFLLGICIGVSNLHAVVGKPGYDNYNGGHGGYNGIGPHKTVVDYYSKPQYAFGYEVDDYYTQLSHGRWEVRDGDVTQGQYRVLLPDGRIQIVSYIADKGGYRPTIQYIGKGHHPPPPPTYAHIKPPKHIPDPYIQSAFPIGNEVTPHHQPEPIVPIFQGPTGHGHGQQPLFYGNEALNPIHVVDPLGIHQHGGRGFKGRGGYYSHTEPLFYGPSKKREVKLSPAKLYRRRALLYDRTLFRRDIPAPPTQPR